MANGKIIASFTMPGGACNAHFHVFEPGFLHVPDSLYTFPDATLQLYLRMTDVLGIQRMVLVQPTYYGIDNSLLVQTLREIGPQCRSAAASSGSPTTLATTSSTATTGRGSGRSGSTISPAHPGRPGHHRLYPHDRRPCPAARMISAVLHPWHHRRDLLPFFSDFEDTFVIDHMGT